MLFFFFFFSSRRRHTRWPRDWSSDVCSSDLLVKKAGPALFYQLADVGQFAIPAGGPDDHILRGMDAGRNILQDRVRRSEVNHEIDVVQVVCRECRGVGIIGRAQDTNLVLAIPCYSGNQRAGFAVAKQEEVHRKSFNAENAECAEKTISRKPYMVGKTRTSGGRGRGKRKA